ncbi:aminoglycoside phosphotransferase family protein, partial [Streptococcus mutans]|nr:aminoglycoside phosphotransferase family protein [Streptococcus mutans]
DIFFDTTKLIFNDLDFIKDASLVRKFFDGWKAATNIEIDEKKLWLYLTIQGIGAIQWVDKQKLEINRKNNIGYRNKSIDIVKLGLENLKYEGLN